MKNVSFIFRKNPYELFGLPNKTGLRGNLSGNFRYVRWPPLCLSRTQFGVLLESVSPGMQPLVLK